VHKLTKEVNFLGNENDIHNAKNQSVVGKVEILEIKRFDALALTT
jgi:hypothetical protein